MTADTSASEAEFIERAVALSADFATRAAQHDRDASFPLRTSLPCATRPAGADGAGRVRRMCRRSCHGLRRDSADRRGDPSTALVLLNMQYLGHATLARERRWPVAIYERICHEAVSEIALLAPLRVEPELGTPARGGMPATTAIRSPDGWRLNGHKIYATGSPIVRYFNTWARTDDDPPLVGCFLVPRRTARLQDRRDVGPHGHARHRQP